MKKIAVAVLSPVFCAMLLSAAVAQTAVSASDPKTGANVQISGGNVDVKAGAGSGAAVQIGGNEKNGGTVQVSGGKDGAAVQINGSNVQISGGKEGAAVQAVGKPAPAATPLPAPDKKIEEIKEAYGRKLESLTKLDGRSEYKKKVEEIKTYVAKVNAGNIETVKTTTDKFVSEFTANFKGTDLKQLDAIKIDLEKTFVEMNAAIRAGLESGKAGLEAGKQALEAGKQAVGQGINAGRAGLEAGKKAIEAAEKTMPAEGREGLNEAKKAMDEAGKALDEGMKAGQEGLDEGQKAIDDATKTVNESMQDATKAAQDATKMTE